MALRDIYRQLCFAWLTGNGDLHAKNLSVIGSIDGEWRIAPAYDIPTTLPYRDHTLALSMAGKVEGLSRGQLRSFAAGVGLPERAAESVLEAVLAATEPVIDDWAAGALPYGKRTVSAVLRSLRSRRRAAQA